MARESRGFWPGGPRVTAIENPPPLPSAPWYESFFTGTTHAMTATPQTMVQATRRYEAWLAGHIRLVPTDLAAKHARMGGDAFSFLRATFYRWAQTYPAFCPELATAPVVLAVGDLHVENYGTWRDTEGRLIWGVNDFDEACPLPYTNDLVRLAVSAVLALAADRLALSPADACANILDGSQAGLDRGGEPFVLSERHRWLRETVTGAERDPIDYWEKLTALPTAQRVPVAERARLRAALPEPDLAFRVVHRQAGLGSLGRPRFAALAEWHGGWIARETKPLLPSAATAAGDRRIYYAEILRGAVRAPDPFLLVSNGSVLRRLSPYCSRIELRQMPRGHATEKLLRAMGRELANLHLGTPAAVGAVHRDLRRRQPKWLRQATAIMTEATLQDWRDWRKQSG